MKKIAFDHHICLVFAVELELEDNAIDSFPCSRNFDIFPFDFTLVASSAVCDIGYSNSFKSNENRQRFCFNLKMHDLRPRVISFRRSNARSMADVILRDKLQNWIASVWKAFFPYYVLPYDAFIMCS